MAFGFNSLNSLSCILLGLAVTSCTTTPGPAERGELAANLARSSGMVKTIVQANGFALVAYQRSGAPGKPMHVYIEGDGYAWASRRRLSDNPTPTDPLTLRLAVQDTAENVVYLARPCQYLEAYERQRCTPDHWSTGRFSEEVVAASDQAIEQLRVRANATGLNLIGYSGGGAVAALVAARRSDVLSLRTVAGNLDHAAFASYHGVTPLSKSLNPASYGAALANIPQLHFIGAADKIMPELIVEAFVRRLPTQRCVYITTVSSASHDQGWIDQWPQWLALPILCSAR